MKTLFLVNNAEKYTDFKEKISQDNTIEVSLYSYQDLAFSIDEGNTSIKIYPTNQDLKVFSKIIILATSPYHLQNYIFSALSCYCTKNHIALMDDSFSNTDGKLYSLWRFWEKQIPVAKTFFGPMEFLAQKLHELGDSGILKSVQGTKGKDNYLINSCEQLEQVIHDNQETRFILQNFIPNNGDWRIILTNYEPRMAIYRSSDGKDHRNNTSVGGDAKLVALEEVDPKIVDLAIASAKALGIKIAGADIMQDAITGEYTVLEVNRTPQLVTGAFIDEKMQIIQSLIHS